MLLCRYALLQPLEEEQLLVLHLLLRETRLRRVSESTRNSSA
jgi:hypothetical protein